VPPTDRGDVVVTEVLTTQEEQSSIRAKHNQTAEYASETFRYIATVANTFLDFRIKLADLPPLSLSLSALA